MPQLDPSSFASQLFWLSISFILLYTLLAYVLLPRVQSVLHTRSTTIGNDIEQANQLKSDAEKMQQLYEKALTEARANSHALLVETTAQISAKIAKKQSELDADIEKKIAASEADIAKAKKDVTDKLAPVSGELASMIVELLVHYKPDAKDMGLIVSEIVKDRNL